MKKLILSLSAVLLIATAASAQGFEKGDWFLGARSTSLGLTHSFLDGESATNFNLQGAGGYFLSDKFAVEAALGFETLSVKGLDSASNFLYGIGVRYYPVSNLFASVKFQGEAADDFSPIYLGVEVGYDLFLSEKVFFEPSVFYTKGLSSKYDESNNLGLAVSIGVKF